MQKRVRFSVWPFGLCLSLLGMLVGLAGCGSGSYSPSIDDPVPLPADAAYDKAVTSAGYTITDLGPGRVADINTSGQVLGSYSHAYLWTKGRRHYLGVLPGDKGGSEAVSFNDSGQVLGISFTRRRILDGSTGPRHAFVWQNGAFTPIAATSSASTFEYIPQKINNAGQALLWAYTSPVESQAVLWQNGQITPITVNGISGKPLAIISINNNGALLGYGYDSPAVPADAPPPARSYLVQYGQVTDLGFLPDRMDTRAVLLNDTNQIVGTAFPLIVTDPNLPPQPFVWQNGQLTVLNGLPDSYVIHGLNNSGFIVGAIQNNPDLQQHAFVYNVNSKTFVDLDATVGKSTGWTLGSATAINAKGQIVGDGFYNGQYRSFLLSPLSGG